GLLDALVLHRADLRPHAALLIDERSDRAVDRAEGAILLLCVLIQLAHEGIERPAGALRTGVVWRVARHLDAREEPGGVLRDEHQWPVHLEVLRAAVDPAYGDRTAHAVGGILGAAAGVAVVGEEPIGTSEIDTGSETRLVVFVLTDVRPGRALE